MLQAGVNYRVEELIPHRARMCLLDTIEGYGEGWLRAAAIIRPANTFATDSGVPGWVGIEFMAQAASAYGGIEQVQRGETPTIGVLIGARRYRCALDVFPHGMKLEVHARITLRDADDFVAYECTLASAGQHLADCVIKAYRPRDLAPLLEKAAHD
jgi:predicted hotdog family 3-hydroxylacyl-ACP dehydratase